MSDDGYTANNIEFMIKLKKIFMEHDGYTDIEHFTVCDYLMETAYVAMRAKAPNYMREITVTLGNTFDLEARNGGQE